MSVTHTLTRLAPGTVGFEFRSTGIIELSVLELQLAIAEAERNIAPETTGIFRYGSKLILARCTDCQRSINDLERDLAWRAVRAWWDLSRDSDAVSKIQLKRLAQALVFDHRQPDVARKRGESAIAHFVGVNWRTWVRKYKKIYFHVWNEMQDRDSEIEREIGRALENISPLL